MLGLFFFLDVEVEDSSSIPEMSDSIMSSPLTVDYLVSHLGLKERGFDFKRMWGGLTLLCIR